MEGSTLLAQGNTKKYDIPVSNLDYAYVKECKDVKMLEKIYRVLKSGDEGCYPDLERFTEEKIAQLNPNSRALRKEAPVATKSDLQRDERETLDDDLKSWTDTMKTIEDHLKKPDLQEEDDGDLPPIRSGSITLTADGAKTNKTEATSSKKRVMPREYRDWDKVDVDKELEKIDQEDTATKQKTIVSGNTVVKDIPTHVDTKGLSDSEKLMKATREKDKGNEAFRASDFKEAITYYSRSISLQPTAASYNNRALAYLKNTDWQKAIADCNKVLSMESDNVKALLRRGTAYKSMKKYDTALADLNKVIEMEPNNRRAKELIEETEKIIQKEKKERKAKGRRMKIQDVDELDEEEEPKAPPPPAETPPTSATAESKTEEPAKSKPRKMKIEEVEDDDEEEEDETADARVNGDISVVASSQETDSKPLVNGFAESAASVIDKSDTPKPQVQAKDSLESDNSDKTSGAGKLGEKDIHETDEDSTSESDSKDNETEESAEKTDTAEESVEDSAAPVSFEDSAAPVLSRPVFYMKEYPASCLKLREEANSLFKNGQYGDAQEKYTKVIHLLEKMQEQVLNLSLTYSNRAACHLKTGDLPGCVKDCNVSLELVPHSVKPLLRRATAYEHLERYKKAYIDYRHVLLLDSRTEQAHLGTKRCQTILHGNDGPRWREKLELPQVSPWDRPEIIGLDGQPTTPAVFPVPVTASSVPGTSSSPAPSVSSSPGTSEVKSQQTGSQSCSSTKIESKPESKPVKTEVKEPEKSPQEKFDILKAKGNEHVKNGKFRDAIQCYSECAEILPDQTVSYTNRALCYIRTNQGEKAEEDCSKALAAEKDNVKALFRRAQARKMLKRYRDGIEDLTHLLKVDPKNSAAKKEMDILKNYWREELESMKKNLPGKSELKPGASKPCPSKAAAQSGAGKQRKKMVIEEVESDEETTPKGSQSQRQKSKDAHKPGPKIQEVPSKSASQKQGSKPVQEKPTSKPVQSKSDTKTKPVNKKSQIKETSSGLPKVPRSVPKLDKATPYEFISAWNALKNTETVKPYYELLKQIKPADIKTVISNKLDGHMLNVITKCVAEHYIANGEEDESYQILNNLSAVPRFGTVTMFMSAKEKSEMQSVMESLSSHKSSVYSTDDVQKLRKLYSV